MDFTGLAEHLVEQLATEGIEISSETVQGYIDAWVPPTETINEEEEHTCDYTIHGKDGKTRKCGKKKAANVLDGMRFCGTETSGHYKSALAAAKKNPKSKGKSKTVAKAKSDTKDSKVNKLIKKVVKVETLDIHETEPGSGIWFYSFTTPDGTESRIAFDPSTEQAIGILDDDNVVNELTEDALLFLEAHNIHHEGHSKPKSKSKVVKTNKVETGKVVAKNVVKTKVGKTVPAKATSKVVAKAPTEVAKTSKTPSSKVMPKVQPKTTVTPKGKTTPTKTTSKVVAKTSTGVSKTPTSKVIKTPVKKTVKKSIVTEEEEETLEKLQQGIENVLVEVEPDITENGEPAEEGAAEEDAAEILNTESGDGDEVEEDEVPEEDVDEVDVPEEDEGEALDADVEEEEAGDVDE